LTAIKGTGIQEIERRSRRHGERVLQLTTPQVGLVHHPMLPRPRPRKPSTPMTARSASYAGWRVAIAQPTL